MSSTTSLAKRNEICTLGLSTGGRPIRFHALYCSGKISLNGRARAKSSAVASGTSTASQSCCEISGGFTGGLRIASPFASICLSQTDGADRGERLVSGAQIAAHREAQDVKPSADRRIGKKPGFTILNASILAAREIPCLIW